MIAVNTEIQIERKIGEVFHFVTAPQFYHLWNSAVVSAELLAGIGNSPGSKIKLIRRFHGKQTENILIVKEYLPEKKYALKSIKGPTSFDMEYHFHTVENSVHLDVLARVDNSLWLSIFGALPGRLVRSGIDNNLAHLKYLLENNPELTHPARMSLHSDCA